MLVREKVNQEMEERTPERPNQQRPSSESRSALSALPGRRSRSRGSTRRPMFLGAADRVLGPWRRRRTNEHDLALALGNRAYVA